MERYSEDILTDGTAKVHLVVEAGKDPGTEVGLDDTGSIAEFVFDFIVDAKSSGSKNEDTGTGYRDSYAEVPFWKNEIAGTVYE